MRFYLTLMMMLGMGAAATASQNLPAQPSNDPSGVMYLFSYFQGNGETGLHLAYSEDGLKWTALNNNQSILKPAVGGRLMRDPSIVQGPDGMFHMVWTTGWWESGIGYASSPDLIQWFKQSYLPVMQHETGVRNCWAPELFYDADQKEFMIFWASTIPGRFPATEVPDDTNNRMYYVTTKDFQTFSETKLFFEPGFNVIDSFLCRSDDRYVMILKNEVKPEKNLRLAFAEDAQGPYGEVTAPITGDYWAEGPTAIRVGGRWIVYFDKYTQHAFGAVSSPDWVDWTDISDQVQFPKGIRHGTAFVVQKAVAQKLIDTWGN